MKVPAWLNDPIYYHNRGNTTFTRRERARWAISSGSTISTPSIRASLQGMIEIYGSVDRPIRRRRLPHRYRAARESRILAGVRPGDARARARRKGIPNFHIFGEVATSDDGPRAHGGAHARRQVAERARFRVRARGDRRRRGQGRDGRAGASCSAPTRSTKAARTRRGGCRHSSAITTPAASRCFSR